MLNIVIIYQQHNFEFMTIICVQKYFILDVISNKFNTTVAQLEKKMRAALHRLRAMYK